MGRGDGHFGGLSVNTKGNDGRERIEVICVFVFTTSFGVAWDAEMVGVLRGKSEVGNALLPSIANVYSRCSEKFVRAFKNGRKGKKRRRKAPGRRLEAQRSATAWLRPRLLEMRVLVTGASGTPDQQVRTSQLILLLQVCSAAPLLLRSSRPNMKVAPLATRVHFAPTDSSLTVTGTAFTRSGDGLVKVRRGGGRSGNALTSHAVDRLEGQGGA